MSQQKNDRNVSVKKKQLSSFSQFHLVIINRFFLSTHLRHCTAEMQKLQRMEFLILC